ncbi:hypothetical protein EC988_005575 [Linderina pennispora]|nr:hypothetical protein EC988_005575 [Linderina pennispora]
MSLLSRRPQVLRTTTEKTKASIAANPDTTADKQCNQVLARPAKDKRPKKIRCMFCDFWTYDDAETAMAKHTNFYHGWK